MRLRSVSFHALPLRQARAACSERRVIAEPPVSSTNSCNDDDQRSGQYASPSVTVVQQHRVAPASAPETRHPLCRRKARPHRVLSRSGGRSSIRHRPSFRKGTATVGLLVASIRRPAPCPIGSSRNFGLSGSTRGTASPPGWPFSRSRSCSGTCRAGGSNLCPSSPCFRRFWLRP
jgi:hypothetical protein